MTKNELINKIADIAMKIDDIEANAKGLLAETKELRRIVEDLPDDSSEIED